jgi:glycosyltransferase involved in cell wall biosynthesis
MKSLDIGLKIAIDASRNRSGGAIVHIVNILKHFEPSKYENIHEIHLWAYEELLDEIPDFPWLKKHCPSELRGSILTQLFWQYYRFPKEIKNNNCSLLFSLSAASICRFKPYITMSRDMLSFEKKEFNRYFFSVSWLRLYLLKFIQLSSFRSSEATIFLTNYAREIISQYHNIDYDTIVINHGISDEFRIHKKNKLSLINEEKIVVSYVSNSGLYKHNWNVIEAVSKVREKYGFNIKLQLLGAKIGDKKSLLKTKEAIDIFDPFDNFVLTTPKINHSELVTSLKNTDIFLFASTCENMPNTLIEGMSTSLPIICSDYGPMTEIIDDCALFFDPEKVNTIVKSLHEIIINDNLRLKKAKKSYELSTEFSWKKCSYQTFEFINDKIENLTKV